MISPMNAKNAVNITTFIMIMYMKYNPKMIRINKTTSTIGLLKAELFLPILSSDASYIIQMLPIRKVHIQLDLQPLHDIAAVSLQNPELVLEYPAEFVRGYPIIDISAQ